ncbi:hypothetical protein Ae201684_004370 [Aphanomyces euteiches]|uniref:Uncharacterized protein n=1 Tax=Aphanomyces euteiches TaxID=100861 RepID=A0A6G0XIM6_9STRA|nr:hypothetical protein Ae201684_004370 [Aphanomyces euteiches]
MKYRFVEGNDLKFFRLGLGWRCLYRALNVADLVSSRMPDSYVASWTWYSSDFNCVGLLHTQQNVEYIINAYAC